MMPDQRPAALEMEEHMTDDHILANWPSSPQCAFHLHALWCHFHKGASDDQLLAARERFWCRQCASLIGGHRIRPRLLDLAPEIGSMICLPMPPELEWKRAVNRLRS